MRDSTRWSVRDWLWAVAFAALGCGVVQAPAEARSVVILSGVGHSLWALAFSLDKALASSPKRSDASGLIASVQVVFALAESLGTGMALTQSEYNQALWFVLGLSFAVAGMLNTLRRAPGDAVIVAQMLFHFLMVVPALAGLINLGMAWSAGRSAATVLTGPAGLTRTLILISAVAFPPLFLTIVGVLAFELTRPRSDRNPIWTALLGHQAAFVVIVLRWGVDGL